MKRMAFCSLVSGAIMALAAAAPARAGSPTGLSVPIGDASRSDQEYVWISNASNLPLFVERVYPGLESARKAGHLPFGTFDHNLSKVTGAQKL